MNYGPRYNWNGMSEDIKKEIQNDYRKKQTIKGFKKALGIVLAIGIGTIGAFEYIHNKVKEERREKIEIAQTNFKPKTLEDTLGVLPNITTPQIKPTVAPLIKYESEMDKLANRISRNKQIRTALQEFQQDNPNGIFENYYQLEQLMSTTNPEEKRLLAEKGFMYFINIERKLLVAYVGDSVPSMYFDAKHIKATYERRGRQYEFHIRYTNNEKHITIASPKLERDNTGNLVYVDNTISNLPINFYERLIFIGEHNKYNNSDGTRNRFAKIC